MTAYADVAAPRSLPSPREIGLWAGAAVVVLVAHATIAYGLHAFQPAEQPPAAEPALMIDLTPLEVSTPEAIRSETVTEDRPQEVVQPVKTTAIAMTLKADTPEIAEPATTEAVRPEPIKPEVAEALTPDAAPRAVEPEKPAPEIAEAVPVEPELTAPEVVTAVTPEVVLPVPEPRPIVEEEPEKAGQPKKIEKKKAEAKTAKTEKAESKSAEKKTEKKKVAKAEAAPAPKSTASVESRASKAPTVSPARWQSKVVAWLNRHKRYPPGAKSRREQGTVRLAFAINASGRVISVRIAGSSGNSELDQAALDMVRRASPVPAPPPEIARSKMNLAVPVQFSSR